MAFVRDKGVAVTRFVLVHGAFAGPWLWEAVSAELESGGHEVDAVSLPSCGPDPTTLGGLPDDVAAVRAVVEGGSGPCVLVAHSYGGFVVTELADHPLVEHTVYVSAFWPQRGMTLLDFFGTGPLPSWAVPRADGALEVTSDLEVMREALANDFTPEAAAELRPRFVLFSGATFAVPSTAPERGHATTYVVTDRDHAIPPPAQLQMASQADHVAHLETSHQPMLVQPGALAALLTSAAARS